MEKPPDSDTDLTTVHVQRASNGDTESLSWIIERFSPLLLAQARYHLGRDLLKFWDPEDLVNETWAIALPKLPDLDPRDGRRTPPVLRFLTTTLLNLIKNLIRRRARRRRLGRGSDGSSGDETSNSLGRLPAEQSGVVTRVVRREAGGRIAEALGELDELDREIIVLRGIEQQPNKSVALLLDINPDTLSSRYRRALARLRTRLPNSVFEDIEE